MIRVCRCQVSSPPPLPTLLISMVGFSLLFRDTTKSHYACHGLHAMHRLQEEREERSKTSSLIISKLMQEVDVLVSASVCSPRICLKCTFVEQAEFLAHVHTGDGADPKHHRPGVWRSPMQSHQSRLVLRGQAPRHLHDCSRRRVTR